MNFLNNTSTINERFNQDGYIIWSDEIIRKKVFNLKDLFLKKYKTLFNSDINRNRNLLKCFSADIEVSKIFSDEKIKKLLQNLGVSSPLFCGPIVSHYTSSDPTGNNFGLPLHQDWPSMASSLNSKIIWFNLVDTTPDTNGIQIASGKHAEGIFKGVNQSNGYVLENEKNYTLKKLTINAGDLLVMSSFLPHKTFINSNDINWKLSLSRRYDDLDDDTWSQRNFLNAYSTQVNRDIYRN